MSYSLDFVLQTAEEILGYLWRIGYLVSGRNSIILVANKIDLERSRVIPQEGIEMKSFLLRKRATL